MAWKIPFLKQSSPNVAGPASGPNNSDGTIYVPPNSVTFPYQEKNLDFNNPSFTGYPYTPENFNKMTNLPSARQSVNTNKMPLQS